MKIEYKNGFVSELLEMAGMAAFKGDNQAVRMCQTVSYLIKQCDMIQNECADPDYDTDYIQQRLISVIETAMGSIKK